MVNAFIFILFFHVFLDTIVVTFKLLCIITLLYDTVSISGYYDIENKESYKIDIKYTPF